MKKLTLLLSLLIISVFAASAQDKKKEAPKPTIPAGSKIFISPMEGGLNSFLATEIIKQKLPITIVTEDKDADYVMVGASIKADDKWYHTVFNGKDKNEGSVQILSVKEKILVWAGEAGDRSLLFSEFRRGGQRKVADRIVKKMKEQLFR